MKTTIYLTIFSLAIFLGACSNQDSKSTETKTPDYKPVDVVPLTVTDVTLTDSLEFLIKRRGKKVIHETGLALKMELKKAIKENGLENAIGFCSTRAMPITDSMSHSRQVIVRRLAKKYRNPLNETLGNENTLYKTYVVNWLTGMKLDPIVSWDTAGRPIYYHPIKVEALCLNCHGSVEENIPPGVAAKIEQLYPNDKAIDFKEGELRGMWAVTFPEYRVIDVKLSQ